MKVQITGATHFVNRMFEACGNFQWARELLRNSGEAGATRVEFGIEWQAVESRGTYRRTVIDNGRGMSPAELHSFFSTLGEGGKKIGGVHDNFGVGAKIATLPWNPEGVVVVSYQNGRGSMIWIMLEPDSGDYELVEFSVDGKKQCVIDPDLADIDRINWGQLRPDWVTDHGTIVVLLGSDSHKDTVLGNPQANESSTKGLSVYLNTRFWDLSNMDVRVVELRTENKTRWPIGPDDKDDTRRPNNRRIQGAKYYLETIQGQKGHLAAKSSLLLDEKRVAAEWYLWEGQRPDVHTFAKEGGYIALRYKDELFDVSNSKVGFRWFGVIENKVQSNLTIILEPQHYQVAHGNWGIHPDQSRNRLIFTGNGERGVAPPLADWGGEFASAMPQEILDAITKARGDVSGSIESDDYRKRLQDRFGRRWFVSTLVAPGRLGGPRVPGSPASASERVTSKRPSKQHVVDDVETPSDGDDEEPITQQPSGNRRVRKTLKVVRRLFTPGGEIGAAQAEMPVDVPKWRFEKADAFENPLHLALWAPNDSDGPTVVINVESPILQEVIQYHQNLYPEVYAEEIATVVRQVFGEVAACKVAHSQKLANRIPAEELDRDYRSEQALTLGLMGLIAEEALITPRLGRFGRKKTTDSQSGSVQA
jgi:hypothetical protein